MNGLKLNLSLSKKPLALEDRLVGEIAADHPLVGDRIVGLANARLQQELNVEDGVSSKDDEVRRLFPFLAA